MLQFVMCVQCGDVIGDFVCCCYYVIVDVCYCVYELVCLCINIGYCVVCGEDVLFGFELVLGFVDFFISCLKDVFEYCFVEFGLWCW